MGGSKYRIVITRNTALLCFVYLMSFLYLFSGVEIIGFVGLLTILVAPIIVTFCNRVVGVNKTTLFWAIIIVHNAFLLFKGNITEGIYNCLLQILIISFVICFQNFSITRKDLEGFISFMHNVAIILVIYNFALLILSPRLGIAYSTYKYAMRTVLFGALIIGLFRKESNPRQVYIRILLIGALMFIFTERTMAVGMIVLLVFYLVLSKIKNPKKAKWCFFIMVAVIVLIPFCYIALFNSTAANDLNILVSTYTHKNLFSGRQVLWVNAINMIKEQWLVGYGYGNYIFAYGAREMSVHNIYLFILLQGGVCNLVLIIGFFYSVFSKLVNNIYEYYNRLSAAVLLMIMFLASFGLILFVNDILYSMMLWTCVGIGLVQKDDRQRIGDKFNAA